MWFLRRCVILVPLLFVLWANRASAEIYELECRKVDTSFGDAWLCQRDWDDGSRISDEQRKSVNVLVVSSLMFPKGRKR